MQDHKIVIQDVFFKLLAGLDGYLIVSVGFQTAFYRTQVWMRAVSKDENILPVVQYIKKNIPAVV